jgi:hypothetical protein
MVDFVSAAPLSKNKTSVNMVSVSSILPLFVLPLINAFAPVQVKHQHHVNRQIQIHSTTNNIPNRGTSPLNMIDSKRRKQLGIADDEDEYDLGVALSANTDPGITKIIAGSFILVMIALLVMGLVIPSLTDYGEGVCSPIQNGGRC